nr:PREDICTED: KH domain-containing, RNA-binding, signal transduction-associated protein 2-like isoform X1 [Bemisia tabaci]
MQQSDNMENENSEQEQQVDMAKQSLYIKELLKEKMQLDPEHHANAMRLVDEEVQKAQTLKTPKENRYVDIYREKPIRVAVKVLVPVKEHPRFNFVGKLLGPKGNSLKRLQEETMCKMAILGRGSMRDKAKEEELRQALDPKYAHLADELHVEIVALAAPAEAHARIAFALAELSKYLVPDLNDEIHQEQMREIQQYGPPGVRPGPPRAGIRPAMPPPQRAPMGMGPPVRPPRPALGILPPPRQGPPHSAGLLPRPGVKTGKVLSILDRARAAMEESSYGAGPGYDAGYDAGYDSMGYELSSYNNSYNGGSSDYYDSVSYPGQDYSSEVVAPHAPSSGRWKGYSPTGGSGKGPSSLPISASRYSAQGIRHSPYGRPKSYD